MAKSDVPAWTIVGVILGMITASAVNPNYTLVGALLGGLIGYFLGRVV